MTKPTLIVGFDCDDLHQDNKAGLTNLKKIFKQFPTIKITLFCPTMYHGSNVLELKLFNGLNKEQYEIGIHGFFHHSPSGNGAIEYYCDIKYLEYLIAASVKLFPNYSKIYRPPGWVISSSGIRMLQKEGYIFAGHSSLFKDFTALNIHEEYKTPKTKYAYIHCHIASNEGNLNGIDDEMNYQNTLSIIQKLEKEFNVEWRLMSNIYNELEPIVK